MYKKELGWIKHLDFIIIDTIFILVAFLIAYSIRFSSAGNYFNDLLYRRLAITTALIVIVADFMTNNLRGIIKRDSYEEIKKVMLLSIASLAIVTLYLYAAHEGVLYSRLQLLYTFMLFVFIDWIARIVWKSIVIRRLKNKAEVGNDGRAVVIVTESDIASEIVSDIKSDYYNRFNIKGLVLVDQHTLDEVDGITVISSLNKSLDYICRNWIDEVFIYLNSDVEGMKDFYDHCAEMGVTVHQVMVTGDINAKKQYVEHIGNRTVLTTAYTLIAPYQAFIKRVTDIIGGLVGSIIAILIGIVIGPIIYAKSPGSIIFKQKRIGKNGRQFNVLKFRSMYLDAEERKKELMAQNRVSDGMMFKMEHDPRIIGTVQLPDGTWKEGIGEFIRKTSLDEFPQFFNVLKGDMSLVGTRPPTVDEWEKYKYHHRARLAVKPGITGMWQVSGRSEITDFEEVVKLDTQYIVKFRLLNDIKILFKTVKVLFKKEGAM